MIYLRDLKTNEWKEFELSDMQALKERNITIEENVKIGDDVYIDNGVTIKSYANISSKVKLGLNAYIDNRAIINWMAQIGNNAYINNGSFIGHWGKVADGERPTTIRISGVKNIYYWGEDVIQIMLIRKPFDYWISEEGREKLKKIGLTEEQVGEYTTYFLILKSLHETAIKRKRKGK